ncbi:restriction endonuclease [Pseudoalteromonas sp. S3260]|uniref:restriction endonuclease subunit S n=1 Tax=Pseudoalteromonas sp. S3260 TaxID=579534 RepID=UPI00110A1270|nr:restriction endonuclease subunit S [Pseudoalteromonas sp. S3260]TMO96527.1 restriction endonuclease [Pseudoalteromonas sp. S3260]
MSWPLVKLSEVAEINPRLPKNIDEAQEVTFLPMASISEQGQVLEQEKRILGETRKGFTYFEKNDVVVAKITPCFENGKAAYLDCLETQIGFGTTEFHVIRADIEKLDGKYLFYLVWNKWFRHLGERNMSGSAGQKRVPSDFLKDLKIPLPPLDEQKRIAAILDKADAIRRKRKQAIQLADDFLRSVFLDMFGDPVSNPKGWKKKPLKELTLKLGSGSTPRGGKEAYLEEGISLIRSLNVHDNKFVHKDLAFISDTQADKLKNVVIEKDDLLLNITGASVCRATLVDNDILPARVNQHVCIIRAKKEKVLPTFLARLITSSSYKQKLMQIATAGGATREALTKQQVESLDIIVPPLDIQEKFMSIVGKVEKLLKISELQSQKPLFNSLSQKAFAGEL